MVSDFKRRQVQQVIHAASQHPGVFRGFVQLVNHQYARKTDQLLKGVCLTLTIQNLYGIQKMDIAMI